ncbi:MAG: M23 family metallopeptidase [Candidatus Falkowbacteria bacterium]|nr:M23 family metallopeptidase [Candidatus Falkowbacteria bacterium]
MLTKKILDSSQISSTRGKISGILMGRIAVHSLIIILGIFLIYSNLAVKQKVTSSDELVGKTKLANLIGEDRSDSGQLIEDYPNLNVAVLDRRFKYGENSLRSKVSILTKEQGQTEESATKIVEKRSTAISYTIQNGDTISSIARRFGISINTILWENDLKATSLIKPGNQLTILPSSGVGHTVVRGQTLGAIAKLYDVSEQDILKANGISNPNQIKIGEKLLIPGASQLASASGNTIVKATTKQVSLGAEKLRAIISSDRDSTAIIPAGGRMAWPTTGHRITQYYSWRHTGVDIADHIGTPIYAADSGVVTTVGYNRGGYGNQIIISHGGGKTTRYGHLSAFDVVVGQKVTKGQYIAAMGSTGRSTGPHLHFEVMLNGARYNPLNYTR